MDINLHSLEKKDLKLFVQYIETRDQLRVARDKVGSLRNKCEMLRKAFPSTPNVNVDSIGRAFFSLWEAEEEVDRLTKKQENIVYQINDV